MKVLSIFALLLFTVGAFGKEIPKVTAYQALRLIGSERDKSLLNHVIEVKGRNGASQPEKWIVVLDDPLARGGVREIEVARGRIVSERTPVKTYSGSSEGIAMNFSKLNLDSEGAFTVAEEYAKTSRVGFHAVDYVLRCDDSNAAPIWVLQLLDDQQRNLGTISIAADNGAVLSSSFAKKHGGSAESRPHGDKPRERREDSTPEEDEYARTHNLGHRMDRAIHRAGADLEEFFTGRRSMDRRFRGEPED